MITDAVVPRTPSGGIALCHDHQRAVAYYGGFLELVTRRLQWEASEKLEGACPRCGEGNPYILVRAKKFSCRKCHHHYSAMSGGRFRANKLPPEKIAGIVAAWNSGLSGPVIAKRFGVQVVTVYRIRNRALG